MKLSKWIFLIILFFTKTSLAATDTNQNSPDNNNLASPGSLASQPVISQNQPATPLHHPLLFLQHLQNQWWFHPTGSLTVGAATAKVGESHLLSVPDDCTQYQYSANHSSSTRTLWGGFIGNELPVLPQWDIDVGIGYYQPSVFSGHGALAQGMDPQSTDIFSYGYRVKSQQLLAESRILWHFNRFHPYALLGLGASFNTAYGYETNDNDFLTFTPLFSTRKSTNFSYSVGAGVDVDVIKNWRVGLVYSFADLGRAKLGSGVIGTTPITNTLSQEHLYANEWMAQLTYTLT